MIRPNLMLWAMLALALGGCAEYEDDATFGEAVRGNIAVQAVTPVDHPKAPQPVALDGAAAKAGMDNYVYSYIHPQAQTSSVSSALGASSAPPVSAPVAAGQIGSY